MYQNTAAVVKYAKNGDIIFCFGSLVYAWVAIGDKYVEQAVELNNNLYFAVLDWAYGCSSVWNKGDM